MAMGPEEKKKAYLLGGLAGLLGIVGLAVLRPWAGSADSAEGTATPTAVSGAAPSSPASSAPDTPPSGLGAGAPSGAPAGASAGGVGGAAPGSAPQFVAVEKFRDDPFTPFYTEVQPPLPPPPPPPTPRPRPTPTPIPPPLDLPSPSGFAGQFPRVRPATELPPFPGGNSRSTILAGLPTARVSRLVNAPTAPRVQSAPPGPGTQAPVLERSTNKRLAGVAIGDSVRALLEVQDATTGEYRTYIVQPGQRVDAENLDVLRIERTTEGGQTRVRMVVRENGETRIVELREGQRADLAGAGGTGGYPGGEGGYPGGGYSGGAPGGFPPPAPGGFPGGVPGGYPSAPGGYPGNAAPPGFPGGRRGFGGNPAAR